MNDYFVGAGRLQEIVKRNETRLGFEKGNVDTLIR